jgi:predicted nucleic acid-binding protein
MTPRYLVDTNVLLRFLIGEPALQAAGARKLFTRAAAGEIVLDVSPVIVAETYYTLTSFYGVDRRATAEKLGLLLQQHGVQVREEAQVFLALRKLQNANVGLADAYLAAGSQTEQVAVASFDKDFEKLKVERFEPTA